MHPRVFVTAAGLIELRRRAQTTHRQEWTKVLAALPAMREGGGGQVVCLNVEDPAPPDPLYEASRAAARVLLRELARELSAEGIRASEVTLDSRRADPERCAEAVRRLLADPPDTPTKFSFQRVPEA